MSIHRIARKNKQGRVRATGWQARVRVYKTMENGMPDVALTGIHKNFLFDEGFNKSDAEAWQAEELRRRTEIEESRQRGRSLPAFSVHRTVEELAEYYLEHFSFVRLEPRSQTRIRGIVHDFLKWNREFGRPYADQWTRELAEQRLAYIWQTYEESGRQLHAQYEKRLFQLELSRPDKSITDNPWPPIPQMKTKKKRSLVRPRAYTEEEVRAMEECATPYDWNLWKLWLNTGLREKEMDTLRRERVHMRGMAPVEIVIETHVATNQATKASWKFEPKNHRDRTVPLNASAREAMLYLLEHGDASGYVVRRDWRDRSHAYLRAFDRMKNAIKTKYPHLRAALSGNTPRTRTTPHTLRKTFTTNLIRAGVSVVTVADLIGDEVETVLRYYAAVLDQSHIEAVHLLDKSDQHIEHSVDALIRAYGREPVLEIVQAATAHPTNGSTNGMYKSATPS